MSFQFGDYDGARKISPSRLKSFGLGGTRVPVERSPTLVSDEGIRWAGTILSGVIVPVIPLPLNHDEA
jgi:hypothetical protein